MTDWVRITYEIGGETKTNWAREETVGKNEGIIGWVNVETGQPKEIPIGTVPFVVTFDVTLPPSVWEHVDAGDAERKEVPADD